MLEIKLVKETGVGIDRLRELRKQHLVNPQDWVSKKGRIEYTDQGITRMTGLLLIQKLPKMLDEETNEMSTTEDMPPTPPTSHTLPQSQIRIKKAAKVVRLWGNPTLILCECEDGQQLNVRIRNQQMFVKDMRLPIIIEPDLLIARLGCQQPTIRGKLPFNFRWERFLRS